MNRPWPQTAIHFIDFEGNTTTGVIEYGIVTLQDGTITQTQTDTCRPAATPPREELALTRLSPAQLTSSPPFSDHFDLFCTLRETGTLAAHYAAAENTLLKSTWPYPRSQPTLNNTGTSTTPTGAAAPPDHSALCTLHSALAESPTPHTWSPWIDTAILYPQLYPTIPTAKLSDLIATFHLQPQLTTLATQHCPSHRQHYHAALYDALAGALLLQHLLTEPSLSTRSLLWLLQHSTQNPAKRTTLTQPNLPL